MTWTPKVQQSEHSLCGVNTLHESAKIINGLRCNGQLLGHVDNISSQQLLSGPSQLCFRLDVSTPCWRDSTDPPPRPRAKTRSQIFLPPTPLFIMRCPKREALKLIKIMLAPTGFTTLQQSDRSCSNAPVQALTNNDKCPECTPIVQR